MFTTTFVVWTPAIYYIIAALVVITIFVSVWRMDARRAERQTHDPQRLNVAPENQPEQAGQQPEYREEVNDFDDELPPETG